MPLPTPAVLQAVFEQKPSLFSDDVVQIDTCETLVQKLAEEEIEIAACTSYSYWYCFYHPRETSSEEWKSFFHDVESDRDKIRLEMAKRFARRHLVAERFNEEKALQKMKETCQWRKEHSLDDLRLCFFSDKEKVSSSSINEDQRERISMFEKCIELELGIQESYMISYDRYGAAIMIRGSRNSPKSTAESILYGNIYVTERALACTELTSKGNCEKTITVCNFNDYKVKNQPSGSIGNDTIAAMQHNYPERLNSYIVTWVGGGGFAKNIARLVWAVTKRFLDVKTREKIHFCFDVKTRDSDVKQHIEEDQCMEFMSSNGTIQEPVNVIKAFLEKTPFSCVVNEA